MLTGQVLFHIGREAHHSVESPKGKITRISKKSQGHAVENPLNKNNHDSFTEGALDPGHHHNARHAQRNHHRDPLEQGKGTQGLPLNAQRQSNPVDE